MTKPLIAVCSALLGRAAPGASRPSAGLASGGTHWFVTWTSSTGDRLQAVAPIGAGDWSRPVAIPPDRATTAPEDANLPPGILAEVKHGGGKVILRSARRAPGVRPAFPSAGLIISRAADGGCQDMAFADDPPDAEILAVALRVQGDNLLAVYLVADGGGWVACRALRFSLASERPEGDAWRQLPVYPRSPGVAAVIAGFHDGMLIAAGGANFPDRPPWEGGVKRTYDEIYARSLEGAEWRAVGRLPAPRAYAAVVSVPAGVLAIGGENSTGVFQDALMLSWQGGKMAIKPASSLPVALASPAATVLDGKVYLAGGYAAGTPRVSTNHFYCLDLANLAAGWQPLAPWPGPSRALAVMAALDGAVYLISGLEMNTGADGKQAVLNYLTDAYRYRPGKGWEKLPDLPWSVVAAPSPAPVSPRPGRVFVFGGVDGRQVGKTPRDRRVPEDIIYFDVTRHEWRLWSEAWLEPVVSAPIVSVGNEWVFVSGETMAGHRTMAVTAWRPGI
ncbi:hypothetical protein [Opitutus sp. GAS368]|uniref:hypothetical protein n=1 Tax=Opitutus sp. GAS368 TaxID=1882749 RepID=UPI0012FDD989|nr:hypothetical protein [Opitutus sp. GAS368]